MKILDFNEMFKILVIDRPLTFAEIFKTLAGILSMPVDLDSLSFSISEITSTVLISVNVNIDSGEEVKLFIEVSSGESLISEASFFPILTKKSLKDSAICHVRNISVINYNLSDVGMSFLLPSQEAIY